MINKTSIAKSVLSVSENLVGLHKTAKWYSAVRNRRQNLDYLELNKLHKGLTDDHRILSGGDLVSELFHCHYNGIRPNHVIPAVDEPYLTSFIPFISGYTKLWIFNFLNKMQGLRDPVLLRLSLHENGLPVAVSTRTLGIDEVALIDLDIEFASVKNSKSLPAKGSALIEVFHPRLAERLRLFKSVGRPLNEFRVLCVLGDEDDTSLSMVHGSGIHRYSMWGNVESGGRTVLPETVAAEYFAFTDHGVPLKPKDDLGNSNIFKSDKKFSSQGWVVAYDKEVPAAIWHDGLPSSPLPVKKEFTSMGEIFVALAVPDFAEYEIFLHLNPGEMRFSPGDLTFEAVTFADGRTITRKVPRQEGQFVINLTEVLKGSELSGFGYIKVGLGRDHGEFNRAYHPTCPVYYFQNGKLVEGMHTQGTFGYRTDPYPRKAPYRCLKWAPYFANKDRSFHFIIFNIGGMANGSDPEVKIRVITDKKKEFVLQKIVPHGEAILVDDDSFSQFLEENTDQSAVILLEAENTNFSSQFFALSTKSSDFGVEHFIGS